MPLKAQREVIDTLTNRSSVSRTSFSAETRQFCLRLQFHSTAAYNELRTFFGNRLPTCRTLRKWLFSTDASPGITQAAVDEIAQKVKEYKERGEKLYLCAMSDDISIRKHISFDRNTTEFRGFPTEVSSKAKGPISAAKEALVFMAVGPDFKIAVAYFLLNGLPATDRAVLTKEVLIALQKTGARIVSLTGDGLSANISVVKMLGADFNSNRPYFVLNSRPNEKIYAIFDPPHMLKLIRRNFAYHKLYYKNDALKWELLDSLASKQDNDNFELGNKLSRDHINFKAAPMKVSLATQAMSNGVADALEQLCEDQYEEFIGCESLVKFIRLVNNVFDVQNYGDGKPEDEHFKQPLRESNINEFRELFQEFEEFMSHMEVDEYQKKQKKKTVQKVTRKNVLKSRCAVGFFGFLTNIKSILGIYADYIESGLLRKFDNFQFSQDHLETFFSLIRSSLGWNNNPNQIQFMAAYRKLLVCMPHLSARSGNCIINSTDVLTVPSTQKKLQQSSQPSFTQVETVEIDFAEFYGLLDVEIEPYDQHKRAIIASTVENNIIKQIKMRSKSTCQDCLTVFGENTKIIDTLIAKKQKTKPIAQPCNSTFDIISSCDIANELLQSHAYVDIHVMAKSIFCILDTDQMYDSSDFHTHQHSANSGCSLTHKEQFIYNVIKEYLCMKSKKIGKRLTIEEQKGRALRRKLTRSIILAGQ